MTSNKNKSKNAKLTAGARLKPQRAHLRISDIYRGQSYNLVRTVILELRTQETSLGVQPLDF